ncbi:hypothetical protein EYR40_006333 [Pleurotus pulmonarius]|nr:hypothetical protein EYR36_010954 [Pleurotus pulmonarius]KAF4599242.1 hypothetical protein EYR40_006333 [Pleurotus pulmonarius]
MVIGPQFKAVTLSFGSDHAEDQKRLARLMDERKKAGHYGHPLWEWFKSISTRSRRITVRFDLPGSMVRLPHYFRPLLNEDAIVSAVEDGRVPWISSDDIADAAFDALTSGKIAKRDLLVVGPELLTYEEIADMFTEVLGRKISFKRVSREGMSQHLLQHDSPPGVTAMLSALVLVIDATGRR